MCAAPQSKVVGGTTPEEWIVQCCPETPVVGGKHKAPSRFCASAADNEMIKQIMLQTTHYA